MESTEQSEPLQGNNKTIDNSKKRNYFQRKWDDITLEPMWFGVSCSFMISILAYKNLYIQRACLVDLDYSEDICFNSEGSNKTRIEIEAQKVVSGIMVGSTFAGGFITIILVLFLAPWSDASGKRKPLIMMPIVGMIFGTLAIIIMQEFPKLSTIYLIYGHAMPIAMGGHFSVLYIAAFSHLGDICYKTGRCTTTVMGTNSGFFSFFMIIGTILGPILYRTIGFRGLFIICLFLEMQSLMYVIFRVKNVNEKEGKHNIFNLKFPLQAVICMFKKRDGAKRRNILLMAIIPCCNTLINVTEIAVSYLYLRNQFDWTEVEYGALLTYRSILSVLGTFVIVSIMKGKYKVEDNYIGIIGGTSQLLSSIGFLFSFNNILIFTTAFIGILARGAMIADRPVLNKQIVADEQGKVSCVMSLMEKFFSFIIIPTVNLVYSKTLDSFPSCFILFAVFASIIQIICYIFVKTEKEKTEEIQHENGINNARN